MLQLDFGFKSLTLDVGRYSKAVAAALEHQVLTAGRAALRDIVKNIPVYTGEARGSLKPIARFLNVEIPINPIAFRKGHDENTGEAQSSCELTKEGPYFPVINIDVELFHVRWNEFNESPLKLTHPTPWHAFEAGRKAFQAYMKRNLKREIPKVSNYITLATLKGP